MVTNRLCDPRSKLGIKEWLKGAYFPGFSADEFIYHQALRSMDWLISEKDILEQGIADKFLTLFDRSVQVLFYDITSSYFTSDRSINSEARNWEDKIDGVLVLETTEKKLLPSEIVAQYKNLQDVERGFRTLKSSLDLRPNYHWTKERIKAHVFICVIALQISRLMRKRLSRIGYSWKKVIERLRGIKTFVIKTGVKEKRGITVADKEQKAIYRQLEIPFPKYQNLITSGQM